jgi:hypothetical protein
MGDYVVVVEDGAETTHVYGSDGSPTLSKAEADALASRLQEELNKPAAGFGLEVSVTVLPLEAAPKAVGV